MCFKLCFLVINECRSDILCVLDRASSWYLNKGWPTRWHLLYYILLNIFQTLIRPSSGASEYLLCCVGWLEACLCYVAGLSVGDVVSECRLNHCPVRIRSSRIYLIMCSLVHTSFGVNKTYWKVEAFAAVEFNKLSSDRQPRQYVTVFLHSGD